MFKLSCGPLLRPPSGSRTSFPVENHWSSAVHSVLLWFSGVELRLFWSVRILWNIFVINKIMLIMLIIITALVRWCLNRCTTWIMAFPKSSARAKYLSYMKSFIDCLFKPPNVDWQVRLAFRIPCNKIVSHLMLFDVVIFICFRPGVIQSWAGSTEEVWLHGHWQDSVGWDLRAWGSASGGAVWHITRWWYQHQCCLYESSARQILRESLKGNQK